jgi:hypothetical protein
LRPERSLARAAMASRREAADAESRENSPIAVESTSESGDAFSVSQTASHSVVHHRFAF